MFACFRNSLLASVCVKLFTKLFLLLRKICCFVNNNHFNHQASKIHVHVSHRFERGPEGPGSLSSGNGHSGAIYRGTLMLYTKYQGSSRILQEYFQDFPKILFLNQICPQAYFEHSF